MKHTRKNAASGRRRGTFAAPLLAASALLLAGSGAFAATDTYNGTGTTFSTGFPGIASGDSLSFGAAGNTAIVNDLSNLQIGPGIAGVVNSAFADAIDFTAGAPAYTISGNDFVLGGNIVNSSGVLQTINNSFTVVPGGNTTNEPYGILYDTGTGGLTFGGNFNVDSAGDAPSIVYDLQKQGTGTLTLNGAVNNVNSFWDHNGTVVFSNGTATTNNYFTQVGTNANTAVFTLNGNAVYNNLQPDTPGPGSFDIGFQGATGTVNVNGTSQLNIGDALHVGEWDAGTQGFLNINGGTVAKSASFTSIGSGYGGANTGTMNVTSGSFQNTGNGAFIVGDFGTGTLNISGTGLVNLGTTGILTLGGQDNGTVAGAGAGDGTVNLDGGSLIVNTIAKHTVPGAAAGDSAFGTFNFNGGTLQPTADNADYIQTSAANPLVVNVRNGGAVIDTASHAVAINVPLTHSAISGDNATDGGLTKNGDGTLTLTAANTYTGATTVNGGTLALANTSGPAVADANVIVNGDGTGGAPGAANGALALNAANQLSSTTNITMHGGTVTIAGASGAPSNSQGTSQSASGTVGTPEANGPGTTAATFGAGTLTVEAGNSYLDFGAGNSGAVFAFSGYDFNSPGKLFIENYMGNSFNPNLLLPAVGGGPDQLYFGANNQYGDQQLANVFFVNPSGVTGTFQAHLLSTGEVAAPEPGETVALLLGAFGLAGLIAAKRRKIAA